MEKFSWGSGSGQGELGTGKLKGGTRQWWGAPSRGAGRRLFPVSGRSHLWQDSCLDLVFKKLSGLCLWFSRDQCLQERWGEQGLAKVEHPAEVMLDTSLGCFFRLGISCWPQEPSLPHLVLVSTLTLSLPSPTSVPLTQTFTSSKTKSWSNGAVHVVQRHP